MLLAQETSRWESGLIGAVMEYREYPFIVRRRTSDTDRGDITTELSTIQASLNKYVALLRVESNAVSLHYQNLVAETRRIAGVAIAAGWDVPVRDKGEEMHVRDVDLSSLVDFDHAFITAVKRHLAAINSERASSAAIGARSANDVVQEVIGELMKHGFDLADKISGSLGGYLRGAIRNRVKTAFEK